MKPCKTCGGKRYANTSFCYKCFRLREKEKKAAKLLKQKERKESTKKFSESLRKKLHKQAWRLMSEWIRRKDANLDGFVECYTCGAIIHFSKANAGHFKHDRLDFDERNLKCQCVACNLHNSGRLDVYAENLIRDFGLEWFNQLCKDATAYNKYEVKHLETIIVELTKRLKTL